MVRISYSTMGFGDRSLEQALDAIVAAGFDYVELGAVPHIPLPITINTAAKLRRQLEHSGLVASTMHAPLRHTVLGPPSEEWRRERVKVLTEHIRLAGDIGVGGIVVHQVPNPIFLPDGDIAAMVKPMQDATRLSLDELVPVATAANVRVLLENMPYHVDTHPIDYPLTRMRQLRSLVDAYPLENVGLVVNVGHAWTGGNDPVSEIEIAGNRLWGTHLQDVDATQPEDNHWVPTHGGLDWPAICTALRRVGYDGAWTFEVINARHGESCEELANQSRIVAANWGL